jgi:hypothetical protein
MRFAGFECRSGLVTVFIAVGILAGGFCIVPGAADAAAALPAAVYGGTVGVSACDTKSKTINAEGTAKESSGGCPAGSASAEISASSGPMAMASQTDDGGTGNVTASGSAGVTYSFEVVGPKARRLPVMVTFTGSLAGSGPGDSASASMLASNNNAIIYSCGSPAGKPACGGFTKTVKVNVTAVKKINPLLESLVQIIAVAGGGGDSSVGSQSSSASISAKIAIAPGVKGAGKYHVVVSPGVGN